MAAPSASADTSHANVTGFTVQNVHVASWACRFVPVTMHMTSDLADPDGAYINVTTNIYRNGVYVDFEWLRPNSPDTWLWCPSIDGFGSFRLGPSDVDVLDANANETTAVDNTVRHFKIKQSAAVTLTGSKPTSRYWVRLVAHPRHYDVDQNGWVTTRYRTFFQYRLSHGTVWHTAGWGYPNRYGNVIRSFHESGARYWRARTYEQAAIWGAYSGRIVK